MKTGDKGGTRPRLPTMTMDGYDLFCDMGKERSWALDCRASPREEGFPTCMVGF